MNNIEALSPKWHCECQLCYQLLNGFRFWQAVVNLISVTKMGATMYHGFVMHAHSYVTTAVQRSGTYSLNWFICLQIIRPLQQILLKFMFLP
jgi:hypothetical protein